MTTPKTSATSQTRHAWALPLFAAATSCLFSMGANAEDSSILANNIASQISKGQDAAANPDACGTLKSILLKKLDDYPELSDKAMDHVQRAEIYSRLGKNNCADDSGANYAELEKKELSVAAALDDMNEETYKKYYDAAKAKIKKHGIPVVMDILDFTDSVTDAVDKR
ncbi:MAG: hypothetical protein LBK26_04200 [Rickettsiales bacterium]|jgi:hypothetical protein|nr:hypothetical protein [Rickettsiales bacterium]